jgi:hypothetical protein
MSDGQHTESEETSASPETTGLPVLHTWRAVYVFVLGSLVFWVALLLLLSALFA